MLNLTVTAKVKAVDLSSRRVTGADPSGDEVTVVADRSIQRLNEVREGDNVTAHYVARPPVELQAPTAAESTAPLAHVLVSGRAPRTVEPAAGAMEADRALTTVEAIDGPNMLVALRGPMWDLAVARPRNADNIKRLKRGETIVITFWQAVGMTLDKTVLRLASCPDESLIEPVWVRVDAPDSRAFWSSGLSVLGSLGLPVSWRSDSSVFWILCCELLSRRVRPLPLLPLLPTLPPSAG